MNKLKYLTKIFMKSKKTMKMATNNFHVFFKQFMIINLFKTII